MNALLVMASGQTSPASNATLHTLVLGLIMVAPFIWMLLSGFKTLPQLLTRIAKQVDMRFELDGPNLAVMPDSPFLKHYKVDYVNMARNVTGTVSANTQIATGLPTSSGAAPATGASATIGQERRA